MTRTRGVSLRYRIRILQRDGYRCAYCGRTSKEVRLEVDHIVPRARGGSSDPENLITACWECNAGKSAEPIPLPDHITAAPLEPRHPRVLRPGRVFDPRFDRYRPFEYECSECGRRPALTLHFLPSIPSTNVLFQCGCMPELGGYTVAVLDLFSGPPDLYRPQEPSRRYTAIDQIMAKTGGRESLWLLRDVLDKEQAWRAGDLDRYMSMVSA